MLRKGLAMAPENYHLNFYLGTNLRNIGKTEEAVVYYRKIVELVPDVSQMLGCYKNKKICIFLF